MSKLIPIAICVQLLLSGCQTLSPLSAPTAAVNSTPIVQETAAGIEGELPIFDTHMHYSQDAWAAFTPEQIIAKLEAVNVPRALVSSSPDEGTRMLYELDPDRIVPSLRPYHGEFNSSNWYVDPVIVDYLVGRNAIVGV